MSIERNTPLRANGSIDHMNYPKLKIHQGLSKVGSKTEYMKIIQANKKQEVENTS